MAEKIMKTLTFDDGSTYTLKPDWENVDNKPFGTEYVETGNVTEKYNATISQSDYSDGDVYVDTDFSGVDFVDQKVNITINGEVYETTGVNTNDGVCRMYVGDIVFNTAFIEPGLHIDGLDPTVASYTIKIEVVETKEVVTLLDSKYLDTEYIQSMIDESLGVIENGTY